MSYIEAKPAEELKRPLTQAELGELAFTEAVAYAGSLATKEAKQTNDNFSGALLHMDIAFGD